MVVPLQAQTPSFNYAEALQKAIFFYEEQISGPKPSWSRVSWRGDSALDDGDDAGRDLTGGWFDAGDHVKFGFAMASSATMLAWGGVEYRAAFESKGPAPAPAEQPALRERLLHQGPSLAQRAVGTRRGRGLRPFVLGLGGGHAPEDGAAVVPDLPRRMQQRLGPGRGDRGRHGASSIVFRPTDPAYANTLLSHARQLFSFAQAIHPSYYVDCMPGAPYYNSRDGGPTGPNDEMAWAAVWLHRATGEAAFLTTARQLYATMCKESQSNTPCFTWTQSWNDKQFGTYVLMAKLTGEQAFHTDAQRWLDYWSVGAGTRTPGGLMFVHSFGSLRYATNTAFIGLIYADLLTPTSSLYGRYHDFAKRQVDYVLGANPRNSSYMVGFGSNPPRNPHHRTAHGTWLNNPTGEPNPSRHTLYGAMVAGPNAPDDFAWTDSRNEFTQHRARHGHERRPHRRPRPPGPGVRRQPAGQLPGRGDAGGRDLRGRAINVQGSTFTEIRSFLNNQSAWPPASSTRGLSATTSPSSLE
jgi:hypothetical protein